MRRTRTDKKERNDTIDPRTRWQLDLLADLLVAEVLEGQTVPKDPRSKDGARARQDEVGIR